MHRGVVALKALCLSVAAVVAGAASAPSFADDTFVSGSNSATGRGAVGGVQSGYNWQYGPAVFGFEADFSGADLKSSMSGGLNCPSCSFRGTSAAASTSSSIDWYGTVRGRLGFASGPVLLYGTGGLAYGKVDLASSFSVFDVSVTARQSSVRTGWVVGGGIELMLQPNVTLNLGYQRLDLGTVRVASDPGPVQCCDIDFLSQNASTRARFETVTLGLSWKFASADPAGAPSLWQGGYLGGHAGGAWGATTFANYLDLIISCFTATTPVLMADGTSRPIAAVKIGDEVMGENGAVNRVVAIETPALGHRKLYAFDGGPAFVTPEHPFMTRAGWKSITPEATFAENNSFRVGALKVGDDLARLQAVTIRPRPMTVAFGGPARDASAEVVVETRFTPLETMTPHDGDPFSTVYNLRLDGNHTYFANGYLVHNK